MKIKSLLSLLIICFFTQIAHAQKQDNSWTMGVGLGLDFNGSRPLFFPTVDTSYAGSASVSDRSGKLLFYSDGKNVYNRFHKIMPNGRGLLGGIYVTQSVAITQANNSDSLYYVFTLTNAGELKYSVVNILADTGRGAVDASRKNIEIAKNLSRKMIVAGSCKNDNLWLICHDKDTKYFYVWKVNDPSGITPAVVSVVGPSEFPGAYNEGEMKISPDGKKLVLANNRGIYSPIEFYDFDGATGMVSNYKLLEIYRSKEQPYSVEFSPDNSKLYTGTDENLYQYDLSVGYDSLHLAVASKLSLSLTVIRGMRLGPDDKLYFITGVNPINFSRIVNPNLKGFACTPEFDFLLSPFPNIFPCNGLGNKYVYLIKELPSTSRDTIVCNSETAILSGRTSFHKFLWDNGDTSRKRSITTEGTYWVKSTDYCNSITDTIKVKLKNYDTTKYVSYDVACFVPSKLISGYDGYDQYKWSGGNETKDTLLYKSTDMTLIAKKRKECIVMQNEYHVTFTDFKIKSFDTVVCNLSQLKLDATISDPAAKYSWRTGETSPIIYAKAGNNIISVSLNYCTLTDTFNVKDNGFPLEIINEEKVCPGDTMTLTSSVTDGDISWSTGATTKEIGITQPGNYNLSVTKNGCTINAKSLISFDRCNDCLRLPDAFTPDNNGRNDIFKPFVNCTVISYELSILNRWGQKVFESTNANNGWDGTMNGSPLDAGLYYYLIKGVFGINGSKEQIYKGDITLIR